MRLAVPSGLVRQTSSPHGRAYTRRTLNRAWASLWVIPGPVLVMRITGADPRRAWTANLRNRAKRKRLSGSVCGAVSYPIYTSILYHHNSLLPAQPAALLTGARYVTLVLWLCAVENDAPKPNSFATSTILPLDSRIYQSTPTKADP